MIEKLNRIIQAKRKLVIGLMSGTSLDGIDAALVEIAGHGLDTSLRLIAFETYLYSQKEREALENLITRGLPQDICTMNFALGEAMAEAALKVMEKGGVKPSEVHLIGSHGQTVYHQPPEGHQRGSTLQIGEPCVIAERTGIVTVADFRPRDMAAGGQGAPLVPYVDYLLFRHPQKVRVLQNIGGIANLTVLPEELEEVIAFDTGPGNVLMDGVIRISTHGALRYDFQGQLAAKGNINHGLLEKLMGHPFLEKQPPKSTGREAFGETFCEQILKEFKDIPLENLVSTLNLFTALSIVEAYKKFVFPKFHVDEVLISGGGCHNPVLMNRLTELFRPLTLIATDAIGFSSDAKEAIAFAVLANETIHGHCSNIPRATGARKPVVLGKIIP